jgi:hypothetical protein
MTSVLIVAALTTAQPADPPALPAGWVGKWAGTLTITTDKGDPQELPMTLEVRPLADGGRYTWRLVYGDGEKRQTRDYELVAKPGKPGRFEIDEKNGIRLGARLVGTTLFALFQVGEAVIQSRYEQASEVLRVEMTAYTTRDPLATKPTAGGAEVKSPQLLSVQTAELKKVEK